MNYIKNMLIILVAPFMLGCANDNSVFLTKIKNADTLKSTIISNKSSILSVPVDLEISGNNLCFFDWQSDKRMHILDINTKELKSTIDNGKGPNEMLQVGNIQSLTENIVMVYDIITRKQIVYDISKAECYEKGMINGIGNETIHMFDSLILCRGVYHDSRFKLVKNDSVLHRYRSFPTLGEVHDDTSVMCIGYRVDIDICKSKKLFATIVEETEIIEAYKIENNEIIKLWGLEYTMKPFRKRKVGESGSSVALSSEAFGFKGIAVTNERIYCLHSEKTYKELKNYSSYGDNLLIYNWEGKLEKIYKLDNLAYRITVSPDGKHLYTTAIIDDDIKILKYNLNL